jgi:hypothetical protein
MAIISDVDIAQIDLDTARISWTGDVDLRSWIAINGDWIYSNVEHDGTDKILDISMRNDTPKCIEIHEVENGITPDAIYNIPEYRPTVYWDRVEEAFKYNVYHKEGANGTDEIIADVYDDGKPQYNEEPRSDLNAAGHGVYHFFRVVGKDNYGVESSNTVQKYAWLVDVPAAPSDAEITGTNGTFAITLTI